ncbi:MAG: hypothetical protein HN341_17770 [Verrucomicrobia bacterium]|nr:hypothetical protein [Verrucomicrobiota bacterium]
MKRLEYFGSNTDIIGRRIRQWGIRGEIKKGHGNVQFVAKPEQELLPQSRNINGNQLGKTPLGLEPSRQIPETLHEATPEAKYGQLPTTLKASYQGMIRTQMRYAIRQHAQEVQTLRQAIGIEDLERSVQGRNAHHFLS